jgi:hypothetical protein
VGSNPAARIMLRPLLLVGAAAGVVACTDPVSPLSSVTISVDSTTYHIKPEAGGLWYHFTLTATITNGSDQDVLLSRMCGNRQLSRPAGDTVDLVMGQYGCTWDTQPPAQVIPAGSSFTETWNVTGSNSPQTRPRIEMKHLTGPVELRYWIAAEQSKLGSVQLRSDVFYLATEPGQ